MEKIISELINRVPRWFLLCAITFLVAWFGGLSYVAFFTSRGVEFFPPKIGSDPKIVSALDNLNTTFKGASEQHYAQVTFLRKQLSDARERAASSRGSISFSAYAYEDNARKYETEIKELDEKFSERLNGIKDTLARLELLK